MGSNKLTRYGGKTQDYTFAHNPDESPSNGQAWPTLVLLMVRSGGLGEHYRQFNGSLFGLAA